MGCGCGSNAKTALAGVQTYEIEGDQDRIKYLTELDAIRQKAERNLDGDVVPTAK
jgi:hypothetical protein